MLYTFNPKEKAMLDFDNFIKKQNVIQKEVNKELKFKNKSEEENGIEDINKYLIMPFWDFAILSTLMVAFFPWSLLFCVFVYGFHDTKLIVLALIHDFSKTVFAILAIAIPIGCLIVFAVLYFSQ